MNKALPLLLVIIFLIPNIYLHAQKTIFVNELMASNDTTLADTYGNYDDWFEIYNSANMPFSLTNCYATNDISNPTQFQFSGTLNVPAHGYLIIWASGKSGEGNDHTTFKLSASGAGVFLFKPDGITLIDSVTFGQQKTDVSYGRVTDGAKTFGYFEKPTPGTSNNSSQTYLGFLDAPDFSVDAGFYANPFQLSITDNNAGATIIYTTDGSLPDANNLNGKKYQYKNHYPQAGELPFPFMYDSFKSQLYSQPLQIINATNNPNRLSLKSSTYDENPYYAPVTNINKATIVRAIAVKNGYISSTENAATYFVTPNGKNHYTLPIISLGIQEDQMFNWDSGVFCAGVDYDTWRLANPNAVQNPGTTPANYRRRDIEFPLTMEFFKDSSAAREFEINAGFRINGGASRANPQKSLRLYFRSEYGSSDIGYKIFPNLPYDDYKRLLLRNSGEDEDLTHMRDITMQTSVSHLKFDTQASRPSVVFISGEYAGILNIRPRYDDDYFEQVYGIDENDLDYLENNAEVQYGDSIDYKQLRSYIESNDMTNAIYYDSVLKRMDMDNYIDYYISKIFFGCGDWPDRNISYFRKRVSYTPDAPYGQDGRYRWVEEDDDSGMGYGIGTASSNTLQTATGTKPGGPSANKAPWSTLMFYDLTKNGSFKGNFINRYSDLLNTSFLPWRMLSVIKYYHDLLAPEMPEHIARWREIPSMYKWNANVNVMDTFAVQRPAYAREHLRDYYNLNSEKTITLNVSDTTAGFIHINTIDITPAFPGVPQNPYPWSGQYYAEVPVTLIAVAKPGYHFIYWQGDNNGTNDTISVSLTSAMSFKAIFEKDVSGSEKVIDYWHFNNLPQDETLTSINADSTLTGNAVITYEGTGAGYMDASDPGEGTDINTHYNQPAGTALRARNPSDTKYLLIKTPTTGYKDIKLAYAATRTAKGAEYQRLYYTTDGTTWILKQDSIQPPEPETIFNLENFDFTADKNVNNNPLFAIKILFFGSQASGSSGNDRFDNITVSGVAETILPLQIISFNASLSQNNVLLNWSADDLLNTSGFRIERSSNAKNFIALSDVDIKNASAGVTSFSYTDADAALLPCSSLYYRLKIVDKSGSMKYSSVAQITIPDRTMQIIPNPVKAYATIRYNSKLNQQVIVNVLNASGKILRTYKYSAVQGLNTYTLPFDNLADGIYIINVYAENEKRTFTIVKQ